MSEYVVDAAAAVSALARKDAVGIASGESRSASGERAGELSEETARTALRALPEIIYYRYPHTGRLADRAWELRHTVTFSDGRCVALAAALDLPLLTGHPGSSARAKNFRRGCREPVAGSVPVVDVTTMGRTSTEENHDG